MELFCSKKYYFNLREGANIINLTLISIGLLNLYYLIYADPAQPAMNHAHQTFCLQDI
jgi:hypothetical protein